MLLAALDLVGRRCVVVGAGPVGARRAATLVAEGALVTVIAPEVGAALPEGITLRQRPYRRGDLAGAALAISATGRPEVDRRVAAEARRRAVPLNVVDVPEFSSLYFTAQHRVGAVVIGVSTEGRSPALAQWVRDRVAAAVPTRVGEVAELLGQERRDLHRRGLSSEGRDWARRIDELLAD